MAGGLTNYAADAVLAGDAIPTTLFLKFHLNDPEADALLWPAVHATRKQVDFVLADHPAKSWNSNTATWPGISADEVVPWFTLWDDVIAGNPWFVGVFSPVLALASGGSTSLVPHRVIINSTPYV